MSEITCVYQNCRGLNTKLNECLSYLAENVFDVVFITETWTKSDLVSSAFIPETYTVFRCDRAAKKGGGVLIACNSKFNSRRVNMNLGTNVDIVAVRLGLPPNNTLLICIYIPPKTDNTTFNILFEALEDLCRRYNNILVMGDFNIPSLVDYYNSGNSSQTVRLLTNFLQFNNLKQFNNIVNINGGILDLVISNTSNNMTVMKEDMAIVAIDKNHPCFTVNLSVCKSVSANMPHENGTLCYNFSKANLNTLYAELLKTDWGTVISTNNADLSLERFHNTLEHILNKHVPRQLNIKTAKFPCWFTMQTIKLIKTKNNILRRHKFQKHASQHRRIKDLRSRIKVCTQADYINFINSTEQNIRSDPKNIWKFINQRRNTSRVPLNMHLNGVAVDHPAKIVETFATHFSQSFCSNNNIESDVDSIIQNSTAIPGSKFSLPSITEDEILSAAKNLPANLTCGVDNIPSFLVKDCITCLSQPLSLPSP